LIGHQREERIYDDRRARQEEGGKLKAEGFAEAGRQKDDLSHPARFLEPRRVEDIGGYEALIGIEVL
jgi:hypothetical protein